MSSTRNKVYSLLNPHDRRSKASNAVNVVIISLILLNVITASLQTVEALNASYSNIFFLIEIISVVFFTVEFILRLWSAPEDPEGNSRLRFLSKPDSIIDVLAIAPFYLSYIFGIDLRALIALRLLRLLKLVRYFEPIAILGAVMKAEFRAFMAAMFVLMILVFIAATGIYFFEREAQPEHFGSIPQSMWWAIVTLTTLGYGDVIPITVAGRIFASVVTILSIGTVALPAGMLASRFSEELRERKTTLKEKIAHLSSDGSLSDQDIRELIEHKEELCLSESDLEKLIRRSKNNSNNCPTCGKGGEHDK